MLKKIRIRMNCFSMTLVSRKFVHEVTRVGTEGETRVGTEGETCDCSDCICFACNCCDVYANY